MSTIFIGAGTAGLAAASDLHAAGQPILVPEARDRAERAFGAAFIHGHTAPT